MGLLITIFFGVLSFIIHPILGALYILIILTALFQE